MGESMTPIDKFEAEFEEHLGQSHRWDAFRFLARHLLSLGRPVTIVETGCVRRPGNWIGDGGSTFLWDWIARETGGHAKTIDIDLGALCRLLGTLKATEVVCGDSVRLFSDRASVRDALKKCDLLYLDSLDHDPPYAFSELHHAAELHQAWPLLPSGCLIAVDDCKSSTHGKHALVKIVMDKLGIDPVFTGYITVWRKP